MSWKARLPVLAAALWWGSLTTVGFLVVPQLFAHLPTPALAGGMAARLFATGTWVSLVCGVVLLMAARTQDESPVMEWARGAFIYVLLGMLLALLNEFAVAPRIVARDNLQLWHSVGTLLYAAQWLCAVAVLWKLAAANPAEAAGERRAERLEESAGSPPSRG